jgi:hypothetical protein
MGFDKKIVSLSSGEKASLKKKKHQENIAKSNPELATKNKESADKKRENRKLSGSSKSFS